MTEDVLNFNIENLGERSIPSPVVTHNFTADHKRILFNTGLETYNAFTTTDGTPLSLEVAGPRDKIFFDPATTKAAIVTCGGLCPGINDVIRAIVMGITHRYSVKNCIGIRYGFQGLIPKYRHEILPLTPETVQDIHTLGGSFLSSSRGKQDVGEMINTLKRMNVDIFFCIGGDGTMRAASIISEEIMRRKLNISVIGVPKTIDNDLNLIEKTFGFDTAISEAIKAVQSAHVEAKGAPMGIGLVKIMGRRSGHIAAWAALAQNDANIVLIPEVPFDLDGPKGLLKTLEERMMSRKHCVILVAEGAGQELMQTNNQPMETDASGNPRLSDIGLFLRRKIEEHFKKINVDINLKYIDPSYMIRSVRANAGDSIYCGALGLYAVHAGMAGKTGMLVGLTRDEYVHIPLKMVTFGKTVSPDGNVWQRVLELTGQPNMKNDEE